MTPYDALALFLIMIGLAAIPSSSVALVVARSATLNTRNGVAASCGIVAGDLIFVLLAILGLSALAESLGTLFAVMRYIAAAYLVWFGIGVIRSAARHRHQVAPASKGGLLASFTAGLALTLGDIKAILFYASLFPAFVDIPSLGSGDIAAIMGITILTVGSVKIGYACAARSVASLASGFAHERHVRTATGGLMIGAGGYLIAKT